MRHCQMISLGSKMGKLRCVVALMRVTNVTLKSFKMCTNTVFTWLAVVNAEDDEEPPFSHRNADEVEAPPCKRSVSHPKAEAANLDLYTALLVQLDT